MINIPYCLVFSVKKIAWKIIVLFYSSVVSKNSEDNSQQYSFKLVIREFSNLIDRICFGYARSLADFEDLRQDALLNLWQSMVAYKGKCSMKTWVYRITLNSCVSSIRKSKKNITTVQLDEFYDVMDCEEDRKEMIRDLHEGLEMLNPIDKAIILLWLDGEEYEEISQIIGISKSNVAIRIHRAKEKLKLLIKL